MVNAQDVLSALDLPLASLIDRRIPKKLIREQAPTAPDRRKVDDAIERIQWVAILKPSNTGIASYQDESRLVDEVAVIELQVRHDKGRDRLMELVHRVVQYPVVLIDTYENETHFSLADKRWSQAESQRLILDGDVITVDLGAGSETPTRELLKHLPITSQPQSSLYSVYRGWMDVAIAFLAAQRTGEFEMPHSPEHGEARRTALKRIEMLDNEISALERSAAREQQIAKRAGINLELQRLRAERQKALTKI